jgi:hypothetical protein
MTEWPSSCKFENGADFEELPVFRQLLPARNFRSARSYQGEHQAHTATLIAIPGEASLAVAQIGAGHVLLVQTRIRCGADISAQASAPVTTLPNLL